ncbi:conserved hypothetical protein [Catenulispora acidiphila DSM 44928]|uniref:Terminase n=1 Tax=Catenulispora acidiphila (strain DSM 44928 / JCM 14897 / NBRC 102108 / NRRL B-24433 / ID139908) TaxID=479433 RepID=C7Q190_CATAD|nr:hypothetical protein [Catenulispora acidiphila]ACU71765.1 conserved hypothetical protein [Catenulispora acidiphila DSM 44928]
MDALLLAADRIEDAAEDAETAEAYLADPARWVDDKLGEYLWSRQVDIATSVRDQRLTAVQSCHGTGKSFVASRLTAWWLDTHPPGEAFVVTTAPTGDQVKAILWAEINKAFAKAEARGTPLPGRINETDWKYDKFLVAFGRKPSDYNPHAFQGIHAKYVLVILDEACGISKQFWTAALAIATGVHCRILAIGNPDDPGSHFAQVCKSDRWNMIKIAARDTPNFTGEEVPDDLADMLVSQAYVLDMAEEFGPESPIYLSKVDAEFPSDASDGVVRLSKLMACTREPVHPYAPDRLVPVELGVDLGAGGDETCIRERRGIAAGREWRNREKDSEKVVDHIVRAIRETGATKVKVDSIGIGWGIVGSLQARRKQGLHTAEVVGVNVSEASTQPEKYARLRSQIWWEVGRKLSEDGGWDLSQLDTTDRDRLVSQLTAPKYDLDASGRIVVEKKEETKKRIGRSPDNADALLLAFYTPSVPKPGIRVVK